MVPEEDKARGNPANREQKRASNFPRIIRKTFADEIPEHFDVSNEREREPGQKIKTQDRNDAHGPVLSAVAFRELFACNIAVDEIVMVQDEGRHESGRTNTDSPQDG